MEKVDDKTESGVWSLIEGEQVYSSVSVFYVRVGLWEMKLLIFFLLLVIFLPKTTFFLRSNRFLKCTQQS